MRLPYGYEWAPRAGTALRSSAGSRPRAAAPWLCAAAAAALAIPEVAAALAIDPWIACPLLISCGLRPSLAPLVRAWSAADGRRARVADHLALAHGVAVGAGLPLATHDPETSLWALAVMLAAFDGADYDRPPLAPHLLAHVAAPLVTIPFFLAIGHPASTAVGIPVLVAVMAAVAYHYGAIRKVVVRGTFARRDVLREQLLAERRATERERLHRSLVRAIAERLHAAASGETTGVEPDDAEGRAHAAPATRTEALALAAREGLAELRAMLDSLAPPSGRESGADPSEAEARERSRGAARARSAAPTYLLLPRVDDERGWNWRRENLLTAAALSGAVAAAVAIQAVADALGVRRELAVPTIALFPAWLLVATALLDWIRRTATRRAVSLSISIGLGNAIACSLPAASGDPDTPLWAMPVMYAAFNGSDYELHASRLVLVVHLLAPLATIPAFVALGAPPAAAVGAPTVAALACFVAYHRGALRSRAVRDARAERARLEVALDDARAARERARLARDLHDGVGSSLSLAALYGDLIERTADAEARARMRHALADAAQQGLEELEALLEGLAPGAEALGVLAALIERRATPLAHASGVALVVRTSGDPRAALPASVRYALLRVAQEALSNAIRHAQPRRIVIELGARGTDVQLRVADDGTGLDPRLAHTGRGRGLANMRGRVEELGGALRIESGARGTIVDARVPRGS